MMVPELVSLTSEVNLIITNANWNMGQMKTTYLAHWMLKHFSLQWRTEKSGYDGKPLFTQVKLL